MKPKVPQLRRIGGGKVSLLEESNPCLYLLSLFIEYKQDTIGEQIQELYPGVQGGNTTGCWAPRLMRVYGTLEWDIRERL